LLFTGFDTARTESCPVIVQERGGRGDVGQGRGRLHKTLVAGAVEVRPRSTAPGPDPNLPTGQGRRPRGGHGRGLIAGRLLLQVVGDRSQASLESFARDNIEPGSAVHTDGWSAYVGLGQLGFRHEAASIDGDQTKPDEHLPMIHIAFGDLDAWLLGTHHGVSAKDR